MPEKIINMYKDRLTSVAQRLSNFFAKKKESFSFEVNEAEELWEMRNEIHKLAGTAGYFEDDEVERHSKEIDQMGSTKSIFAEEVKKNFHKIQQYQEIIHKSKYFQK